jgi:hypothetical protein
MRRRVSSSSYVELRSQVARRQRSRHSWSLSCMETLVDCVTGAVVAQRAFPAFWGLQLLESVQFVRVWDEI